MLSDFLFSGSQKQVVGISLTPGIGLEAVVIDKSKNVVVNYGRKRVEYNLSSREISNYVQFKTALVELVEEMKIPLKSPVYMVLPNVYFDFVEVPETIIDAGIKTALLSNAEQFYLFQKEEPAIGWCAVANPNGGTQKKIAYTAFKRTAIDEIKQNITDVGLQLVGVESANSAIFRGLSLTGMIDDVILEDSSWSAMIINGNSFTLFQLEGKNLLAYQEVPLAIKSFSPEEAYQAIVSSSSQLLSNYSSMKLYIISQTDDISAEALKRIMQFDREIIAIDSNKYSKKPLMEVISALDFNEVNSMTLSVLGAADIKSDFSLVLNVLADDPSTNLGVYFTTTILGTTVEVTTAFVQKLTILAVIVLLLIFVPIIVICVALDNQAQSTITDLSNEIQSLDAKIAAESQKEVKQEVDMTLIIDEVAAGNVTAINFYDSISTDIPKNVWLTKYYNKSGDRIVVRGIAENIIDIYEYYKNLRIVSPQSDIKLTELRVVTQSANNPESKDGSESESDYAKFIKDLAIDKDADRLYSFEISNTQIEIPKKDEKEEEKVDESNILPKLPNNAVEETSSQMKPAQ